MSSTAADLLLTTVVVMQELRITRIVTADQHFRQVGVGLDAVP